ncbi:MAG: hypothetical protein ACXQS2_06465, partial [Methermicoccaceae archaeon]
RNGRGFYLFIAIVGFLLIFGLILCIINVTPFEEDYKDSYVENTIQKLWFSIENAVPFLSAPVLTYNGGG